MSPQHLPRHTIRKRPPAGPLPGRPELGKIIRSRKTEPPKPPPKPFNPAELRAIDKKASFAFSIDLSQLSREFLELRWAHLEDHIQDCADINRQFQSEYDEIIWALVARVEYQVQQSRVICKDLENQYCRIAFRGVPYLRYGVSRMANNITQFRFKAITELVMQSQRAVQALRKQADQEFIKPRGIARSKIDGLLRHSEETRVKYEILKDKYRVVKGGLLNILSECRSPGLGIYSDLLEAHTLEFSSASHFYRSAWLDNQKTFDPLRAAELWDMTKLPVSMPRGRSDPISTILFDDEEHVLAREKLEKRSRLHAIRIRALYMRKWKPGVSAQSPEISLYWRQLDVMAPFFLQLKHYDLLLSESRYLLGTLAGQNLPLWSNITPQRKEYHKRKLHDLTGRIREGRLDLISELASYRAINWTRLGVERRLLERGLPNEIQERGFFVVENPLSQDLPRFERWIRSMLQLSHSSQISRKAFDWSQGVHDNLLQTWMTSRDNIEAQRILEKRARAMDLGFVSVQRKGRVRPMLPPVGSARRQRETATATERSVDPEKKTYRGSRSASRAVDTPRKAHRRVHREVLRPLLGFRRGSFNEKYSTVAAVSNSKTKSNSQFDTEFEQSSSIDITTTETIDSISPLPQDVSQTNDVPPPQFWRSNSQRGPSGRKPMVHYCRTLASTEVTAKLFLKSKIIGFDMEWKAQATANDTIQNNLSLIQIANEERIALFHIALFTPARTLDDFVSPTLRAILESEEVTKVGVSIKADATRLRKFLGIDTRSVLELSHLFKLVKYGQTNPELVNKRMVNLSEQVEEHFGLPLEKNEDVRCGDWSRPLKYGQVQYAATDPYACICLFNAMEKKRVAMDPMPPRPSHAELNLPILVPRKTPETIEKKTSTKPKRTHFASNRRP